MPSSGPNYPSTVTNTDSGGTTWVNPSNAGANDGSETTSEFSTDTDYLDCTNFGFSVPDGTINGVVVEVERRQTGTDPPKDKVVQLIKGGVPTGDNKADTVTSWPSSVAVATYGSSSDGWSASLAASDVNASTFGVRVEATRATGKSGGIANIDYVRITVYYTESGGGVTVKTLAAMGVG